MCAPMRPTRRLVLGASLGAAAAALAACSNDESQALATTGAGSGSSAPAQGSSSSAATPSAPTTTAPASEVLARATVPVLCYHQVRDWQSDDSAYNKSSLICPPKNFAAQLDGIKAAGYTTISPAQYYAHLEGGAQLPAKSVLISLDDGKDNQVSNALPALQQRQMTATFFIMTVILGSKGWMQRDDVKKIADAGMTVGSHTWDHNMVTKYSGKDFATQLREPRELLRKLSGQPVTDFAYPYGAWNQAVLPHLREAGYTAAYQLQEHPIDKAAPDLTLQRMLAVSTWTGADVVAKLDAFARPKA